MVVLGLLFFLPGSALIFTGQRMFWIRQIARSRGKKIEAKIIRWKSVRGRSIPRSNTANREKYRPEVTLIDPQGLERTALISYQFTSQFASNHPIGSSLFVLFDPVVPERILDTSWTMSYFLPALLTLCGGLVMLIGLGIILG